MKSITRMYFLKNVRVSRVYLLLFCFNIYFNVNYSFSDFKAERFKREITNCAGSQFGCSDGQCIDETLVCDGIIHCSNSSDENEEQCRHMYCPSYSFKCAYGACIDSTAKCNGKPDCADNSDELPSICSTNSLEIDDTICGENHFQCASKKCIKIDSICDGSNDCYDGSDETQELCKNTLCNKRFFRCDYGACIEIKYRCDGIKQCIDGSDESVRTCNKRKNETERQTTTPVTVSLSDEFCIVPSSSADKTVKYHCYGKSEKSCYTHGDKVARQLTVATFQCNPGYSREQGYQFQSVCLELGWQPPISNCTKTCDKLTPVNADLKCYRNGISVSCENNLLAGTIARPICKQSHVYKDFVPVYEEIVCQEDGRWNNLLLPCIPGTTGYSLIHIHIVILYILLLILFFHFRRRLSKSLNTKI